MIKHKKNEFINFHDKIINKQIIEFDDAFDPNLENEVKIEDNNEIKNIGQKKSLEDLIEKTNDLKSKK